MVEHISALSQGLLEEVSTIINFTPHDSFQKPPIPSSDPIITTLYELTETIIDEVPPGEDSLVTEIVIDLFATGQIRFIGDPLDSLDMLWS